MLAQQLLMAMIDMTRIAAIIERLDQTANDTNLRLRLAKEQHPAVGCSGYRRQNPLAGFYRKVLQKAVRFAYLESWRFP
jgi:hypothetical protein